MVGLNVILPPPSSTPGNGTSFPHLRKLARTLGDGEEKIHGSLSSLSEFINWKMLLAAGSETNSQSQ
jgi:hypothetical protein